MATNQSHIKHLNRPASVIFRKPLATNEEMTRELEKLLGDVAPIKTHSVTNLKGRGIIKALFIHKYTYKVIVLGYNENLLFKTFTCPSGSSDANIQTDFNKINLAYGSARIEKTSDKVKKALTKWFNNTFFDDLGNFKRPSALLDTFIFGFAPGGGIVSRDSVTRIVTNFLFGAKEKIKAGTSPELTISAVEPTEAFITATEGDSEQDQIDRRTWYVVSFDSDYYVPESKHNYIEFANTEYNDAKFQQYVGHTYTKVTSGLAKPTLNAKVVYTANKLGNKPEDLTSNGQIKELADWGFYNFKSVQQWCKSNKIQGIYKVVFQGGSDYENPQTLTLKQAIEQQKNFDASGYSSKENLRYYDKINDFYGEYYQRYSSRTNHTFGGEDSSKASQPLSTLTGYNTNIEVMSGNQYRIAFSKLFPYSKMGDILQEIQPNISERSLTGTPYDGISTSATSSTKYKVEGGVGYLYFNESASLNDVVTAYFLMCLSLNDEVNVVYSGTDLGTLTNAYTEFPLRWVHQKDDTGYTASFSVKETIIDNPPMKSKTETYEAYADDTAASSNTKFLSFNTAVYNRALVQSYGRGRVGSKRKVSFTYSTRYLDGTTMTMLDFKLMYYLLIKYNVILPKYNKLCQEFMDVRNENSTVRMFPSDFFDVTDSLGKLTSIKPDVTETITVVDDYTTQVVNEIERFNTLNKEAKEKLVDIYEEVYFGDWSGFYYTNSTPRNESISKYTNTKVERTLLTNVVTELSQEKLDTDSDKSLSSYISSLNQAKVTALSDISNTDIAAINISRQTMGKSQASIVINNIASKYTFKKSIFKGQTLFEPMDEVLVYLPTYSGDVTLAFKGIVSNVENINKSGYHNICLTCDCPIKFLDIVRTNIKPSMSFDESDYSPIHPFSVPEDLMKSVDQWVPFIFAQGLSYFFSMLGNEHHNDKVYTIKRVKNKNLTAQDIVQSPAFNDDLLSFMWFRKSAHYLDQHEAQVAFKNLLHKYVDTLVFKTGVDINKPDVEKGITPLETLFSKNSRLNVEQFVKPDYYIYAQRRDSGVRERRLVAKLTGTMQPAFALGVTEIPLVFSEYKTNTELLTETAEKFNFFFYSDRFGVVNFTPPNVSLTGLSFSDGNFSYFDRTLARNKDNVEPRDLTYDESNIDILNELTTIQLRESTDDSKIINWMQISGGFVESSGISAINAGVATTVANYPSIVKYGVHSQKQQAILGVNSQSALRAYGFALMDRNTKNFRTAQAESMGSGDMDINMTVYSPTSNTVFLRTGLILNYSPGNTFTATSTLNWGRKPLCKISLVDDKINIVDFNLELKKLKDENHITFAYYKQIQTIIDFVAVSGQDNYRKLLASFLFNGYFWDGVSSISFEDLATSYFTDEALRRGLQTALFQSMSYSSKKSLFTSLSNIKKNISTVFGTQTPSNLTSVTCGLFDQGTFATIDNIYTRQGDFVLRGKK